LYAAAEGGDAVWSERQSVDFDEGFFAIALGAVAALDPALFAAHESLWLGVAIDGDDEMTRVELGTAPFAGFAVQAGDAATLAGQGADAFAAAVHRHPWSDLDDVPPDLADGDDDTTYDAAPAGGLELNDGAFALLSGCGEGEVLKKGGGGWACAVDAAGETIAAIGLDGTVLAITEGDGTHSVDLAPLATDLDPGNELLIDIALDGTVLQLTDAGGLHAIDLAALGDDDDADPRNELNEDLSFDGSTLALSDAGGTQRVDLSGLAGETNTEMVFDGTTLALTDRDGTLSVDLSSLGDDLDADP
ncbi:MAG: hypothetical protein KC620_26435, partial [Myxococcales bacterium]|nr:hypothetical protein [Myxococcales bacterium]